MSSMKPQTGTMEKELALRVGSGIAQRASLAAGITFGCNAGSPG
jgi:hypothetical protein